MVIANITDEQRAANRARQLNRHKRSVARELAQRFAARALDELAANGVPEWFAPDQAHAYVKELERLRERIAGAALQG